MRPLEGSFRDPNGFVFQHEGTIYRQVNWSYKENYDHLINSGLYESLAGSHLLISHKEMGPCVLHSQEGYKIILPEKIPFISYPYEWCFSQLKDAALLTLEIQKRALEHGMSLKDGSAYNVQFLRGKPIFIDTLSFERYHEGKPWIAYLQFCQHFLAPLALMSYKDVRLNQLSRIYMDGIPLDLAASLMPLHSKARLSTMIHIYAHSRSQKHFEQKIIDVNKNVMNAKSFMGLIDSLESAVKKMVWQPSGTEWADYYEDTNYSVGAMEHKREIIKEFLDELQPRQVWDLGANIGVFSRLASNKGIFTLSFDIDPVAVERNYIQSKNEGQENLLPLLLDLTNPSPAIGWENGERLSLIERGMADAAFALALIHHLAISNNLPFEKIAKFLSRCCKSLIVEFIPKDDSQIKRLLLSREDIFIDYNQKIFEEKFKKFFNIERLVRIGDSNRVLYLMIRNKGNV